jgi:hypothetical protein
MSSEWTKKLSRRQLEVIRQDTLQHDRNYPDQKQDHIHKDINSELAHRYHKRQRGLK